MPHVDMGDFHVRHPDFYPPPSQPAPKKGVNVGNVICWALVIALAPFDIVAIICLVIAVRG